MKRLLALVALTTAHPDDPSFASDPFPTKLNHISDAQLKSRLAPQTLDPARISAAALHAQAPSQFLSAAMSAWEKPKLRIVAGIADQNDGPASRPVCTLRHTAPRWSIVEVSYCVHLAAEAFQAALDSSHNC